MIRHVILILIVMLFWEAKRASIILLSVIRLWYCYWGQCWILQYDNVELKQVLWI